MFQASSKLSFSEKKVPHRFKREKLEEKSELFFRPKSRSWSVDGVGWKGVVAVRLFVSLEQEQWVDPAPLFLPS